MTPPTGRRRRAGASPGTCGRLCASRASRRRGTTAARRDLAPTMFQPSPLVSSGPSFGCGHRPRLLLPLFMALPHDGTAARRPRTF